MAGKFEIGFYCCGNGTTVANKAVTKKGDYKRIAHISEGGNIRAEYQTEGKPKSQRVRNGFRLYGGKYHPIILADCERE